MHAVRRENRLRMKLDSIDWESTMPHAHDFTVLGGCADLQLRGQGVPFHGERMISARNERIGQVVKDGATVVANTARFPLHDPRGGADAAAGGRGGALVA